MRSVLAGKGGLVIPKHIYEGKEIITNPANNAPIGTGPFKLKEWVRGSHVEFVRNENYWNPGLPYLDKLIIRWWRDPASRSAALEAGQLDIGCFNPIPAPDIKRLTSSGRFVADKSGYAGSAWTTTIEFNSRRAVVNRPDVRQALLHAIDWRPHRRYDHFRPETKPSIGFIPASNTIFADKTLPTYPFDADKAGKLLDAAGFPLKDGSRFKVNLVSAGWFEENIKIGQYLKQAFEDVGLTVDLATPDRATSLKRIYTDYDYDIAISNNAGSIELVPEWTQFVTTDGIVKGAAFRNANGFSNPKLVQIVRALSTEPDPDKRVELAHEFQQLVATERPITSLVDLQPSTIARADVRNYSTLLMAMDGTWSTTFGSIAETGLRAMRRILLRRAMQIVPLVLGVIVMNFLLIHLAPGCFLDVITAEQQVSDPALIEKLRHLYGMDQPLVVQLGKYIWSVFTLDLGFSYRQNAPVFDVSVQAVPATLILMLASIAIAVIVGVTAGVIAAVKVNTLGINPVVRSRRCSLFAAPTFWLGIMLTILFSVQLGWLPVGGMQTIDGPNGNSSPRRSISSGISFCRRCRWGCFMRTDLCARGCGLRCSRSSKLDFVRTAYLEPRGCRAAGSSSAMSCAMRCYRWSRCSPQLGSVLGGGLGPSSKLSSAGRDWQPDAR